MIRFRVFRMLAASGFLLVNDGPVHGTVHAQSLGDRVRVTVSDFRLAGEVVSLDEAEVAIDVGDGESRRFSINAIELIERSVGTRSYMAQGLGIGFGAGAVIGIATTLPSDACDRNEPYIPMAVGCSEATVVVATALGALGGIAGLVAGALVRGERWEPIPVSRPAEPTLRFVLDAGLGGHGLPPGGFIGGRLRF